MKKEEYVELHKLLAKLKYEIGITLCEVTNEELINEYQEFLKAINKVMEIFIIE